MVWLIVLGGLAIVGIIIAKRAMDENALEQHFIRTLSQARLTLPEDHYETLLGELRELHHAERLMILQGTRARQARLARKQAAIRSVANHMYLSEKMGE